MPGSPEHQSAFAGALLDPERDAPPGVAQAGGRFNVWRNNVVVGLIDALSAAYPAVEKLVGTDFFRAAAREFVRAEPPCSPILIDYGEGFAPFLDAFPPAAGLPWIGDVARIEWARGRAWHAADAAPIGIDRLAALPQDRVAEARLVFHPSARLVASRWPVATIWAETTGRAAPSAPDMTQGETALIVRPDWEVDLRILPPDAAVFIRALTERRTLAEAAGSAAAAHPEFDLSAHLAGLFGTGAIADLQEEEGS